MVAGQFVGYWFLNNSPDNLGFAATGHRRNDPLDAKERGHGEGNGLIRHLRQVLEPAFGYLLLLGNVIRLNDLYIKRILKVVSGRIVKRQMTVLPNPRQAQLRFYGAQVSPYNSRQASLDRARCHHDAEEFFLRQHLTQHVAMKEFFGIDGNAPDPELACRKYAEKLRSAKPQLCLAGIGENGHLAFNDPPEADFKDPLDVKIVQLDDVTQQQQVAEGWFKSLAEVPKSAITLTVPALLRVQKIIASVPGSRKAEIIRRVVEEPISTNCPATILRTHPDATVYLDADSAAQLDSRMLTNAGDAPFIR